MSLTRTATTRELASFLSALRFEDLPDEVVERTKELFLDWVASALAARTRGRSAYSNVRRDDGTSRGAERDPALSKAHLAALRRAGERRRLARRGTGRPPQRLRVSPRDRGLPCGPRRRPAHRGIWTRPDHRLGGRLRDGGASRKPWAAPTTRSSTRPERRARSPRPPPSPTFWAPTKRSCSTRSVRPGRRPPGCGSSCATRRIPSSSTPRGRIRRATRRLRRPRRVHRRDPDSRRGAGYAAGMSSDASPRGWSRGSGRGGRCRRPRSSSTPHAGTPTPPPTPF